MSRDKAHPGRIVDILYGDLEANAVTVINQVLDAVDLLPPNGWLNSLQAAQKRKPEIERQRHQYTLSQFGLDADDIRERFGAYIKTYDLG